MFPITGISSAADAGAVGVFSGVRVI